MPRLRARLEDLGVLIANLLARIDPQRPERRLSRAAARALFLHDWPFHVRELEQVLRAAAAVAPGQEIGLEDLRLTTRGSPPVPAGRAAYDKEGLVALLERHDGNVSAVARELSTSRTQVTRLLARHGLDYNQFKGR
jgi:DNA-binding NtrC family response regulator